MNLFDSFSVHQLTLKNRVIMAPMCMYMALDDGIVTPFHHSHYFARSYGGVGLIIIEATAIEPRGRITDKDLGIWSDTHLPGLSALVNTIHSGGAKAAIQIAHAGRKSTVRNEPIVGPSAIAYNQSYQLPHELTTDEIQALIESFKKAAKRARIAGFDLIELHGAHGYLINQFLSPLSNQRTDMYGGTLENRTLFLRQVITAIRNEWTGPLSLRISAEEYDPSGHHLVDTLNVLALLPHTIDLINVSSGGVVSVTPHTFPGYQIPFSKTIRDHQWATIGGGLITTFDEINEILDKGNADLVYLGRELLRNPYFMLHAAKAMGRMDQIPFSYERGFK